RRGLRRVPVFFVHRADERDLASVDVRHEQSVLAFRFHAAPQRVADRQALAVLGEARVLRERRGAGIVLHESVEVAVDETLETRTAGGRRLSKRHAPCAEDCQKRGPDKTERWLHSWFPQRAAPVLTRFRPAQIPSPCPGPSGPAEKSRAPRAAPNRAPTG